MRFDIDTFPVHRSPVITPISIMAVMITPTAVMSVFSFFVTAVVVFFKTFVVVFTVGR